MGHLLKVLKGARSSPSRQWDTRHERTRDSWCEHTQAAQERHVTHSARKVLEHMAGVQPRHICTWPGIDRVLVFVVKSSELKVLSHFVLRFSWGQIGPCIRLWVKSSCSSTREVLCGQSRHNSLQERRPKLRGVKT
jgi:hypothetical protein